MFYYSPSFLKFDDFWKYYGNNNNQGLNLQQYNDLRKKYNADGVFVPLYDKIGKMGNKYADIRKNDPNPWNHAQHGILDRLGGKHAILHFLWFLWSKQKSHKCIYSGW